MMTLISPGIYVMIDTSGCVNLPRSFETCDLFLSGLNMLFAFHV
jgi:hypothetical protein